MGNICEHVWENRRCDLWESKLSGDLKVIDSKLNGFVGFTAEFGWVNAKTLNDASGESPGFIASVLCMYVDIECSYFNFMVLFFQVLCSLLLICKVKSRCPVSP